MQVRRDALLRRLRFCDTRAINLNSDVEVTEANFLPEEKEKRRISNLHLSQSVTLLNYHEMLPPPVVLICDNRSL